MNLTATEINNPNTPLQAKLDAVEKAGASIAERMKVALDFLEAEQKTPSPYPSSEPTAADEELSSEHDPITSDPDASQCEPHASQCEPTSDPDPGKTEHEPEPKLPPPPKFQFGRGNNLYEIALDFRSHRDKRSILDHLTDNQRHAIIQLLKDHSEYDVAELLAKQPPAGLGIHVSRPALNRFRKRYQKQQRRRNCLAFQLECERLLEAAGRNDQAFLHASERLLKMRLFQITGDPDANLETISKLTGAILDIRKQTLAERKHADSQKTNPQTAPQPEQPEPNPMTTP